MNITIIGAGNVGGSLGRAWSRAGHAVVLPGRNELAPGVVADADVVVLAVPFAAIAGVLAQLGPLTGKTLIDCTNPIGVVLPEGVASGAAVVASLVPAAHVVKAFNTQGAEIIAEPRFGDVAATGFFCGDDDAAKAVALRLIADVGFAPVDVGPLASARFLEAATLLWFAASRTQNTRRLAFRLLR